MLWRPLHSARKQLTACFRWGRTFICNLRSPAKGKKKKGKKKRRPRREGDVTKHALECFIAYARLAGALNEQKMEDGKFAGYVLRSS